MTIPLVDELRASAERASWETDEALRAAFDEHWSAICDTLYRLVGDWGDAQDLALETFWRLHTRGPRDPSQLDNVGGWLYRVATNLGLNAIRARERRRRYEEMAGALTVEEAGGGDPASEIERREVQERVRRVLAHMKNRKARLLVLRYTGHTYREIADRLDVAVTSVGTMLARAERDFERRYRALEGSR